VAAIGLASLGAAKVLTHARIGAVYFLVGVAAAAMVRPHVAIIAVIALPAALVFRKSERDNLGRSFTKVAVLIALIVGGGILATTTADFLDLENIGDFSSALDSTVSMTNQGGSAFSPFEATNPALYPLSFVTVVFRPFPGEAGSDIDGLLASFTSMMLLLVTLASARRILNALREVRRSPYVMFSLTSLLIAVFVFSVVANFGILDRQRTQFLPYVFVILAGAASRRVTGRGRSPQRESPPQLAISLAAAAREPAAGRRARVLYNR